MTDTSDLNVHELRNRLVEAFGPDSPTTGMQTQDLSFGYKHGFLSMSTSCSTAVSCRIRTGWRSFVHSPGWIERCSDYVLGQAMTATFLERMERLLALLLPAYVREGKSRI